MWKFGIPNDRPVGRARLREDTATGGRWSFCPARVGSAPWAVRPVGSAPVGRGQCRVGSAWAVLRGQCRVGSARVGSAVGSAPWAVPVRVGSARGQCQRSFLCRVGSARGQCVGSARGLFSARGQCVGSAVGSARGQCRVGSARGLFSPVGSARGLFSAARGQCARGQCQRSFLCCAWACSVGPWACQSFFLCPVGVPPGVGVPEVFSLRLATSAAS
jgi:hypothetical protein